MLEKDVNEMYRQIEQLKSGPGGIYELNNELEHTRNEYHNV